MNGKISQEANEKILQQKELVKQLLKEQKKMLKNVFDDTKLIEGSFISMLIKCRKKGCHCEKEPKHLITRISKWEGKKLKNKLIRVADRDWVKEYVENYKAHKKDLRDYEKRNAQIIAILKTIIKMKAIKYE